MQVGKWAGETSNHSSHFPTFPPAHFLARLSTSQRSQLRTRDKSLPRLQRMARQKFLR